MIQVLKDERGYVYAYIEYQIVDRNGQFKDWGERCFVQDLWIHPDYRRTDFNPSEWVLRELIYKVDKDPFMKNVKDVDWLNLKHGERQTRSFIRKRLAKIGERHGEQKIEFTNRSNR